MKIIYAIILGAVQGLTEFLPISSSGHLVLLENAFGIKGDIVFFDLMLHLGTLFAVCLFYRKTLWNLIKKPFCPLMRNLVIATIPTIIIGLIFKDFFVSSFSGQYLIIGFLITAIFLTGIQYIQFNYNLDENINFVNAFIIGMFQGFAIMPGISRSGSTITAGIIQGVNKKDSTEFSFLLSIPVILGSCILKTFDIIKNNIEINISIISLICGVISSFIFGIFSIRFMKNIVAKNKYHIFIIYILCLSIGILIYQNLS